MNEGYPTLVILQRTPAPLLILEMNWTLGASDSSATAGTLPTLFNHPPAAEADCTYCLSQADTCSLESSRAQVGHIVSAPPAESSGSHLLPSTLEL